MRPETKMKRRLIKYLSDKRIVVTKWQQDNDIQRMSGIMGLPELFDTGNSQLTIDLIRKTKKKK